MIPPDEDLVPLNEAINKFMNKSGDPRLKRVSYATAHRWASKGCRGHVLQTALVGGRRYVARSWITAFVEAINSGSRNPGSGGFSPPTNRDDARADEELRRMGL